MAKQKQEAKTILEPGDIIETAAGPARVLRADEGVGEFVPLPAVPRPLSFPSTAPSAVESPTVADVSPPTYSLVPTGEIPASSYISDHVEAARLSVVQASGLKRLAAGLDRAGATLDDGRRVISGPDAIRWMLEQIHAGRLYIAGLGGQESAVRGQQSGETNAQA